MLASPCDYNRRYKMPHPEAKWLVSPKVDGIRCYIADWSRSKSKKADNDQLHKVFSRNGKHIPNRHIRSILEQLPPGLDGELAPHNFFDLKAFKRSSKLYSNLDEVPRDWCFHIFNFCPPDGHQLSASEPFATRMQYATELCNSLPDEVLSHISFIPQIEVTTLDEAIAYQLQWAEAGAEGAMLTTTHTPYLHKRNSSCHPHLLKLKDFEDAEFRIVGFDYEWYRGTKTIAEELQGTRKNDVAGKLILEPIPGLSPDWCKKQFKSGSGFSQAERRDIVASWSNWQGKIATIKYLGPGSDERPRHPIFKGIRSDL